MQRHPRTRPAAPIRLVTLAKSPRAGRVKTRLCPPFTPAQAADLAAAALADTLTAVTAAAERDQRLVPLLVLDGPSGPWAPADLPVIPQRGDGLDERLAAAFDDAVAVVPPPRDDTDSPVLLIGMDTPQLTPDLLTGAADALTTPGTDAVLGRAADGGWWGLGLRRPQPGVLLGVPMSTPHTGAHQLERLRRAGLRTRALPELRDVDTAADAAAVAGLAPGTAFARALAGIAEVGTRA